MDGLVADEQELARLAVAVHQADRGGREVILHGDEPSGQASRPRRPTRGSTVAMRAGAQAEAVQLLVDRRAARCSTGRARAARRAPARPARTAVRDSLGQQARSLPTRASSGTPCTAAGRPSPRSSRCATVGAKRSVAVAARRRRPAPRPPRRPRPPSPGRGRPWPRSARRCQPDVTRQPWPACRAGSAAADSARALRCADPAAGERRPTVPGSISNGRVGRSGSSGKEAATRRQGRPRQREQVAAHQLVTQRRRARRPARPARTWRRGRGRLASAPSRRGAASSGSPSAARCRASSEAVGSGRPRSSVAPMVLQWVTSTAPCSPGPLEERGRRASAAATSTS